MLIEYWHCPCPSLVYPVVAFHVQTVLSSILPLLSWASSCVDLQFCIPPKVLHCWHQIFWKKFSTEMLNQIDQISTAILEILTILVQKCQMFHLEVQQHLLQIIEPLGQQCVVVFKHTRNLNVWICLYVNKYSWLSSEHEFIGGIIS